jgi:DnaJ-domain-containing protein 1
MFEQTDPKTLRTWLVLAALVYLVLPYDVFPDFFGLPGRIDDVLLMAWCVWFYTSHLRRSVGDDPKGDATGRSGHDRSGQGARSDSSGSRSSSASDSSDPYEVLGVPPSASSEAIQAAYRSRMQEYHPDKVAHLGAELQQLALEKTQEIQRAYRELGG